MGKMATCALACLALFPPGGCGGGGGNGGENQSTIVAVGVPDLDGVIQLESVTGLCEIDNVTSLLRVGEEEVNATKFRTFWAFVTFDHSALPAGATITSAVANIRMATVSGDSIFGSGFFGNVVMEHIDIGSTLNESDMTSPSLTGELVGGNASPSFLAVDANLGLKTADITSEVLRDLADGRARTTLRISFQVKQATDGDLNDDFVEFLPFDPADTGNTQRPFLEVRFIE